ncbi:MAG TPA: DUF1700 domain-containing protein [Candidatus Koribacter sp.]|jgi:uncharacterized membrane protein
MTSQEYLQSLRSYLKSLPSETREEIVLEIASHIQDALAQPGASLDAILARLGPPERVAAAYRDNFLLRRARRSFSPVVAAHAAVRLATKGIFGFIVAACATVGYCFGGGMVLVALMKPIFPRHTGLWVSGGHVINSGVIFPIPAPPAHEILGQAIIPICLVLGTAIVLLTTGCVQLFLRTSRFVQKQFQTSAEAMPRPATAQ